MKAWRKKTQVRLSGEVESDEVYVEAGRKGNSEAVKREGRKGRRRALKGNRGRGTSATEKPPIFGMIQRSGEVSIQMTANVRQASIRPLISAGAEPGTQIYTDEYAICSRPEERGFQHKTVNHGSGEYARDEYGDGFCEVHVNTVEGVWSPLRSWLRPHRGISQGKPPLYPAFSEFLHNAGKRGKAVLHSLIEVSVR